MVPQKVKDLLASCGTTPSNAYQPIAWLSWLRTSAMAARATSSRPP